MVVERQEHYHRYEESKQKNRERPKMSKFCGAIRVTSTIYHPHTTNLVDLLGDTETKRGEKVQPNA